jgi:hypothetical protein
MFGSRLYGTQTPTSDIDWKHIVLPDLNHLLLAKSVDNKVKKTNTEKNVRNSADDVDEEFIPLQVFANHFVEGQTYALELAFAIDGTHAGQQFWGFDPHDFSSSQLEFDRDHHLFRIFVLELRTKFLTSNIKAMMGYVVNQASLYSFKGERLNATRELVSLIQGWLDKMEGNRSDAIMNLTLNDLISIDDEQYSEKQRVWQKEKRAQIDALQEKYPKYFRVDVYDIGGGRMKPCLVILEKTLPYTNSIEQTLKVLNALEGKYGARADQASVANVDWKATMHALRIVDEGLQLLEKRELSFPFNQHYVDRLLSIKRGEVPIEQVTEELSMKLDRLKDLAMSTDLPECNEAFKKEFEDWLVEWLFEFYDLS